jgi:hypothetical protein
MRKTDLRVLAGLILLLLLPAAGMTQDQVGGTAQTVGVTTTIEPFMSVTLVTAETDREETDPPFRNLGSLGDGGSLGMGVVEFEALEQPGVIEADKHVQIIVSSNCTSWAVECSSTGLTSPDDFIPPDRLFVRSFYTDPGADNGAGPGYENLVVPKLVATGSAAQELSYQVFLKLEVTWEDTPGDYDGVLNFTVMPTP